MAEKRRGLGRGLGALIPNNTTPVVTASDVAEKEAEKGSGDSQTSAGGTSRRILGKTPEDSQRKAGAAEKSAPKKEPSATTKRTEQQENRISSSQKATDPKPQESSAETRKPSGSSKPQKASAVKMPSLKAPAVKAGRKRRECTRLICFFVRIAACAEIRCFT